MPPRETNRFMHRQPAIAGSIRPRHEDAMTSFDWKNPERVMPWKPRHRFAVTPLGHEAMERYRAAVTTAQAGQMQRTELELAKERWATDLRLRAIDGIVLDELASGHNCLADLKPALESCDLNLRAARGAIDRLLAAGLVESLDPSPR